MEVHKPETYSMMGVCVNCGNRQKKEFPVGTLASSGGVCKRCGNHTVHYSPEWPGAHYAPKEKFSM